MDNLRYYQKEAVENIYEFFKSQKRKAKMYISTGLGKTVIIATAIQTILKDNNASILILSPSRILCDQINDILLQMIEDVNTATYVHELKEQKILITTYQDVIKNRLNFSRFNFMICDDAQFLKKESCLELLNIEHIKALGVLQNLESSEDWFYDAECLYTYMTKDAVKDGYYITEREFIERFVVKLLDYQGYRNILREVRISNEPKSSMRADIVAEKDKKIVLEVKSYRSLYNSKVILNNALKQILQYKQIMLCDNKAQEITFVIVMPCEIDEDSQKEIYDKYNVEIWDISNLIYLCDGNKDLLQLLSSCIPYSTLEIEAKKPLNTKLETNYAAIAEETIAYVEVFQKKLEKCKSGRLNKADKKYEMICTEIIKYLFETEFFKISEQHKTGDEMFRMDLLCSLKGTTEFWKFLIEFYHTKFVVFEYKNYSDYIPQNLIYITEKYLFPVALRNVAFIISRKGFDSNAQMAAIGCLKESGKLIVGLDDNDLIKMVYMKENGEEPSDYLLDKVEQILMSVSK